MKRLYRPMLWSSIFVSLGLLTVLYKAASSHAAAPLITTPASSVERASKTSVTSSSAQLASASYYVMQGGTTAASSLVGEWRFDEAAGASAEDSSGRNLNGTLLNGAAWVNGRYRAGLQFDGVNDYVQVGAQPLLVMSSAMTVSAWIYPTGTGAAGLGLIVNKEGEYEIARFYDGTIRWAFANSAPGWAFIDTGFVAPANQWTHIALTYNNGEVRTYANGTLVHTYAGAGAIGDVATTMNDFRIGGRQVADQYFMGAIDEVAVYNQPLAASDIQKLSQGSLPRNLALRKPATQSTTGWDSPASLAVDGNTDSDWYHGSVSHTNGDTYGWWQVDLGSVQQIDNVSVWLMTVCCSSHENFDVKISSDGVNWTSFYVAGPVDQINVPINNAARYVRVQLRGAGYLALSEVQVWGVPGAVMPGVVQAEDFNEGGEGIAYHDLSPANEGGVYRTTAVDIGSCVANDYVLGWNGSGEWTQYSINVLTAGSYTFQAVIGEESSGSLHVEIDGIDKTGPITIPNTGSWCTLQTISKTKISLSAGQHTMRVVTDNVGVVLDSFRLVYESAYNGTPATIPGIVQIEQYDNGTEGVAYHDNSPTNDTGSTFRAPTGVDVWEAGLGYAQAGEWLNYTVNVATTGSYTIAPNVASPVAGGIFHIEFDGVDKTGPMVVPNTGAWGTYQSISKSGVQLTAGPHVMRFVLDANAGNGYVANFDLINFTLAAPNAAAFVSQTVPASMTTGQLANVSVTMLNTGNNTWTTPGSYNLGSQNPQDNSIWSVTRVTLPNSQPVPSNQQVTFTFAIRAPATPGTYNFQMRMVQDGVEWFGTQTPNVAVTVTTPNQPPKVNAGTSMMGVAGSTIQFSSNGSFDPDGTIAGYSWNFGDGQTASVANPTHTYAAGGNYTVTLTLTDNGGATASATITVAVLETTQSPYKNGINSVIPGTIQAEDFDNGGPEVAYHDDSADNQGGSTTYRADENVDIEDNTAAGTGYAVGWTRAGEWLEYIVRIADTDNYKFDVQVAPPIDGGTGGVFHLEVDGTNKSGAMTVPGSGGAWTTVTKSAVRMNAGTHVIRLVMDSGGSTGYVGRFDYFKFTATQTPYGGTARALPGIIQAEDFDNGEQGTSYSDTTAGNQGGAYRTTDVDIWNSSEGPALGWSQNGEWADYTVDVSQSGTYPLAVRVSSPGAGAKFHIEVDGFDATGQVDVPATGSRDAWQTVQTSLKITSGRHILRLVIDDIGAGNEVCFNSFEVATSAPPPKSAAEAALALGERFTDVDYKSVGVGNLLNSGSGILSLTGVKDVKRAYLYWWGVPFFYNPQIVTFAGRQVIGDALVTSNPGSYIYGGQSWTYRADVTAIVNGVGPNANYGITAYSTYGASLVVIYDDGNVANNRDVTLYSLNDSNYGPFLNDDRGWNSALQSIFYPGSGGAFVELHVAEGETYTETPLVIKNAFNVANVYPPQPVFNPPPTNNFRGNSVSPFLTNGLWDIINFDVTRLLVNGSNNNLFVQAGLDQDVLFIVLAVVNVPHPFPPPSVTITDGKPEGNGDFRIAGNLDKSTRNALAGGQIVLKANGNTQGGTYDWSFTGPVEVITGIKTDTVVFRVNDDGSVPQKNVFTATAKVTFTNKANAKSDATVTINAHVPTLPVFKTTQSAVTLEQVVGTPEVVWQIGSSDPAHLQPAVTFNAKAQAPAGPYLSTLATSNLHFEQNINTMRKVRDALGRVSCKTARFTLADDQVDSGWQGDSKAQLSFPSSNKEFNEGFNDTNGFSLVLDLRQGVEGIRGKMIEIDAAEVDDIYETYVVYESGNLHRRLGSVLWRWGGAMAYDVRVPQGMEVPPNLPPPISNVYIQSLKHARVGDIPRDDVVSQRGVSTISGTLTWGPCPGGAHPQPTEYRLFSNQHDYVAALYNDFLQRSPDDTVKDAIGWYHWSSTITHNGFDEGAIAFNHLNVAIAFLFSNDPNLVRLFPDLTEDRHTDKYNAAFLAACYFGFLHRPPDQDGLNWWLPILNGKNSRTDDSAYFEMVSAFLDSIEYKKKVNVTRTNRIVENYDGPIPPQTQP